MNLGQNQENFKGKVASARETGEALFLLCLQIGLSWLVSPSAKWAKPREDKGL